MKLSDLFASAPHEIRSSMSTSFEVTTKRGETIADSDIERLLRSGSIGDVVEEASFTFRGGFSSKESPKELDYRSIVLSFGGSLGTRTRLSGSPEWIDRVRGSIDPYVGQRRRDVGTRRLSLIIGLSLFPFAALAARAFLDSSIVFVLAALVWIQTVGFVTFQLAERIFPDDLIVITSRGRIPSWYVDLGGKILLAVVAWAIGLTLSAILWP